MTALINPNWVVIKVNSFLESEVNVSKNDNKTPPQEATEGFSNFASR